MERTLLSAAFDFAFDFDRKRWHCTRYRGRAALQRRVNRPKSIPASAVEKFHTPPRRVFICLESLGAEGRKLTASGLGVDECNRDLTLICEVSPPKPTTHQSGSFYFAQEKLLMWLRQQPLKLTRVCLGSILPAQMWGFPFLADRFSFSDTDF